jgi:uncharacterized protein YjbI with pentapeptide repeats
MKSPIRLEDLAFASALSAFDAESADSGGSGGSGGLLEIDGDYDRVRFDGVAFAAAEASGARFIESAFVGGSFDEGRLRKARFTDVWFEQTRLVAVDVAGASLTDVWFNGCVFAGVPAFTCALRRVVFRGCKLDSVNFRDAALTDVTFDDCVLRDVDFARLGERDADGSGGADTADTAGIKAGFDSLSGVRIDSVQLMTIAPQLAHHLGITVSDT